MSNLKMYQRKFLINKKLQLTVLLYSMVSATFVGVANMFLGFIIVSKWGQFRPVTFYTVITLGLMTIFAITAVIGLVLTNRIAGPIYRLKQHMDEIIEGKEIKEMQFRRDDYFSDVNESYNKILSKFSKS